MPIIFQRRTDFGPGVKDFVQVRRKGKMYALPDGEESEFFTIATLAEALGRATSQLYVWETECWCGAKLKFVPSESEPKNKARDTLVCPDGCEKPRRVLPKPLYNIQGDPKRKRWYTAAQIINAHNLWLFKYRGQKGSHFKKREFAEDLFKVFFRASLKVVVDEKGHINL